jgi:hypothetical protein
MKTLDIDIRVICLDQVLRAKWSQSITVRFDEENCEV